MLEQLFLENNQIYYFSDHTNKRSVLQNSNFLASILISKIRERERERESRLLNMQYLLAPYNDTFIGLQLAKVKGRFLENRICSCHKIYRADGNGLSFTMFQNWYFCIITY